jgi:ABC-type nitrate/sulfonate/bicarbonate transport system permease component
MNSIGIQMQIAKTFIEMDVIFAWTIIAIILSLLLEGILSLILHLIKRRRTYEHRIN